MFTWDDVSPGGGAGFACDVAIRSLSDLRTGAKTMMQDFYFAGVGVWHCYEGRFCISRRGCEDVVLEPGHLFVSYPGYWITVTALEPSNRLVSAVLTGGQVEDYFDGLGYVDGLLARVVARDACFHELCKLVRADAYVTPEGHDRAWGYLANLLVSILEDARSSMNRLVFDAMQQIRRNLSRGAVRLEDLCAELRVSRSYLHRVFRQHGLGSVADYVKSEQLRRALWLLRHSVDPVGKIAEATGFLTVSHFSTFIRRRTGYSPRELRNGRTPFL